MPSVSLLAHLAARAATILVLMAMPVFANDFASAYTSHDFETCAKQPSPHPDVVDIRSCKGHSGIPVVWTAEPDASSVDFGRSRTGAIPSLDAFHEVRKTVEWRGPQAGGAVRPLAAIVRYDTGPAIGQLGRSRLVVHRLMPNGSSCLMGVVAGSNEAARSLVDSRATGFVCGRSKAIVSR